MGILTVNQEQCKRDRICAAECPLQLIAFQEKDSFPTATADADEKCTTCGHCVAVCPHNALSLNTVNQDACVAMAEEMLPAAGQIEHFLKSRRSIRGFRNQPVAREVLEKLIDIARYAPSAHNTQPVQWLVIEDGNEVRRLAGLVVDWMRHFIATTPGLASAMHLPDKVAAWEQGTDLILRQAPHVVMAHAPADLPASHGSCIIALTYLELAAYSMGLGACWAGYLGTAAAYYPPLVQKLSLPQGHQVFGAMMIGYPRYRYHKIPPRTAARITWR